MKQQLNLITAALLVQNQNNNWFLPQPITVRLSEQDYHIFEIHGLCVSPKRELYVMDSAGTWNKLEETDVKADKMIAAIHARIMKVFKTAKEAVA
jgi:hypothetical protein